MSGANGQIKPVKPESMHRRAFQRVAADTIDIHAQVIDELRQKVQAQGEFMADMSVRIDELVESAQVLKCRTSGVNFDAVSILNRGFFGRLRWLVTGK